MQVALLVVINGTPRLSAVTERNFANSSPRFKDRTAAEGFRPVGNICTRPGSSPATIPSLRVEIAGGPAIVGTRQKAQIEDPPMPAKLVETFGRNSARHTNGQRWKPETMSGISWVAGKSRNTHLSLIRIVIWLQICVADRPILRQTVEGPDAKVRGVPLTAIARQT